MRHRPRHRHRRAPQRLWLPVGVVAVVALVGAVVYGVNLLNQQVPGDPALLSALPSQNAAQNTAPPPAVAPPSTTAPAVTPKPAPAKAPSAGGGPGRSGLAWQSGIVVGPPSEVKAWEGFRGRTVDVVHGFTERGSWDGVESADWILSDYAKAPVKLVISQPFWPEGSGGSLKACAGGAYDANWARYGKALKAAGRTDAYTRLAWEFNGDWFEWSATDVGAWKQCFRRVVTAVRSTAPGARFEWNMNAHGSQTAGGSAWNAYPGDDVVDVVGIDAYDHYPSSPSAAAFDEQCNDSEGLCNVVKFARKHGKKVGVTEWGVTKDGGDNPLYIQKMFATFQAAKDVMAYETYFNSGEEGNALVNPSQHPDAAAAYRRLFGR
jgi:hypothetical protein